MGFARCGIEGNLRKLASSTRKKPFHFFCKFEKNEMVFASVSSSSPLPVAVARTSQSPFPMCKSFRSATTFAHRSADYIRSCVEGFRCRKNLQHIYGLAKFPQRSKLSEETSPIRAPLADIL
ncbi:hypothetical protein P0M11_13215 [Kaistella sp. PBT33-4]|uniref:hypothetical protein n=1 Tax=Kaistella sp. PBT33-4 TaxID=3032000 RepID=UPI0023D817D2|nr:hypothetical protein [Kaistella sp. PBT33-4]MDF0720959.1 hypothetical protein [Kaistella sp. PBT33-4]